MEPDDLPLQVALLTMEVATQRKSLALLATTLETLAGAIRPPEISTDLDI